jgi:hypothetical protein
MDVLLKADANTVTLLASLVSLAIGILVTYLFYKLSKPGRNTKAYKLLRGFSRFLGKPLGEYYFTGSKEYNYRVAKYIYENADEQIIATSFNEDPSIYGKNDLAILIKDKANFTRLTNREVCGKESEKLVKKNISQFLKGSSLVIIPKDLSYTRIDGIFCKFGDDSYLTFFAFRDPQNTQKNKGVIFRNGIAKSYFEYYESLMRQYK